MSKDSEVESVESPPVIKGATDSDIQGKNTEVAGAPSNSSEKADEKVKGVEIKDTKKGGSDKKELKSDAVDETIKEGNEVESSNQPAILALHLPKKMTT